MKRKIVWLVVALMLVVLGLGLVGCEHEHAFGEWTVEKEADCTEQGQEIRSCSCGAKERSPIPATGHSYGEWIVEKRASCNESGTEVRTCACGKRESNEIPALNHAWSSATCTAPQKCTACGQTKGSELGHSYSEKVLTEATCFTAGTKKFTCGRCNDSYTESFEKASFSATELYEKYTKSVGEIITYDRSGKELALGSCFVYSADGKIITNYHVIENGYSAKITLNGKSYTVQYVLAYDKEIDIAVLKISATNLSAVTLCEKNHPVGKRVYAFGSSKGLTATFSEGIITYSDRKIDGVSYTQHDAPISSGNSGGPLINEYGEVIGINTWTVRDSQNLNFAINVSELKNLRYGTQLTMAQYYEKECDVFTRMKNYIISEGTYVASSNWYTVVLGTSYSSDYTSKYTRHAYYYVDEDIISLDLEINNGEYWVYFQIDKSLTGVYQWNYFDEHGYKMSGTLYASSYSSSSLLGYSYNNISSSSIRTSVRKLASSMISLLCNSMILDYAEIGVDAKDIGFPYF